MNMEIFNVVSELAPTLMKYSEVEPEFIKIKVNKLEGLTNIKIYSDKDEIGTALAEVLLMMAKISETNPNTKVTVEVD